MRARIHRK